MPNADAATRPCCVMHEHNGGHHEPCVHCQLAEAKAEANRYRIEADKGEQEYDALVVDVGILLGAVKAIAERRPNQPFDPWAAGVCQDALWNISEHAKGMAA